MREETQVLHCHYVRLTVARDITNTNTCYLPIINDVHLSNWPTLSLSLSLNLDEDEDEDVFLYVRLE